VLRHYLRWPPAADDDHLRQMRRRRQRRDNNGTRSGGGSCSNTTTAAPHGSDGYTSWPLYLDPWTGTVQMWPGSGGVDVQQPLLLAVQAGTLPYGLPP
jgi:hypothetical protein